MSQPDSPTPISGRRLERADIEAIIKDGPALLVECDLEDSDLSRLDLSDWQFEKCVFRKATLVGTKFENSVWKGCRSSFADFTAARFDEARVQSGDFSNSNFRGAALTGATFKGCKFTGCYFGEAKALNVVFEETLLSDAKLPGFNFRKAHLKQLDFSLADLTKCDFRDASFEGCSLREANVSGARFEGADLRGADLGGLRLVDARAFKGATISKQQAGLLLAELGLNVL